MKTSAIVLAAGLGLRFKAKTPKPLVKIGNKPVIIHCLEVFSRCSSITEIILVVNNSNKSSLEKAIKKYRITKVKKVVLGGRRRQDSVFNGLMQADAGSKVVLIHDGARPFVNKDSIGELIKQADFYRAAILAVPVKATIKEGNSKGMFVSHTLDRSNLWEVQTPQAFKRMVLLKAHEKFKNIDVTDDAALVEKLNCKVKIVMGSYLNIKITTAEDLEIAEGILKRQKQDR